MKTTNYLDAETTKNPHGVDARKLYENDHIQVVHMLLKPGEHLVKHSIVVDTFFYVLEGNGIVEIGDEKQLVVKDMLIESPGDVPHCLYNESNEVFRVLAIKAPKPTSEQTRQAIHEMLDHKQC